MLPCNYIVPFKECIKDISKLKKEIAKITSDMQVIKSYSWNSKNACILLDELSEIIKEKEEEIAKIKKYIEIKH
tara:strand:- start:2779 stop:3000 length:222 start_codon:yes stop_codon:yes gene_type:complete